MSEYPFKYGKLVGGFSFVNRTKEKKMLKINLSSGINTMLISPRRLGKSSLVKTAMLELQEERKDVKVCFIDAFTLVSEEDFYQSFVCEIVKATESTWKSWITTAKKYLKALSPKISIGSDPMFDFSISLNLDTIKENEIELLNLPEKIAQAKKIKLIICIDEFQNLAKLTDYEILEKKMRSVWQHHQNVSYCLYGSKRHMMTDIFNSPSKPFYRFGQIMFLSKISEKDWTDFIVSSFEKTGKKISVALASKLVNNVRSYSWYVQQYAHFTWSFTDYEVTEDILQQAAEQVIDANLPMFQTECEILSAGQINLLIAIANGEKQFTAVDVMNKYRLGTPQNVSKNKLVLYKRDLIDKTKDGLVFLDPVFEKWFFREYVKKRFII